MPRRPKVLLTVPLAPGVILPNDEEAERLKAKTEIRLPAGVISSMNDSKTL
jgi:hypothetical protein